MRKLLIFCLLVLKPLTLWPYDLTVVGRVNNADGLGKIPIGFIQMLKEELSINCIAPGYFPNDISPQIRQIIENSGCEPGTLAILCDQIYFGNNFFYKRVPKSQIKIAYSMFESDSIPSQWVKILNKSFHAVVVPDPYLIQVYENSGVQIPVFMIPLGMELGDYQARLPREDRSASPFIFGTTVSCGERKNIPMVIQAFAEEFGNDPNVVLCINSRYGEVTKCQNLINSLGVDNIFFTNNILSNKQYVDFLDSFHCFINISKGEGFSYCPREALALGIPCILSDNTSQSTICETGLVRPVVSNIKELCFHPYLFGNESIGNEFNCRLNDVKEAMRDVYENYLHYHDLAKLGPDWVSQYSWDRLKGRYLSLVKPKRVILGDKNEITDEYLITNSRTLYNRYRRVFRLY